MTWNLNETDLEIVCGGGLVVSGTKDTEESTSSSSGGSDSGDMQQNPDPNENRPDSIF